MRVSPPPPLPRFRSKLFDGGNSVFELPRNLNHYPKHHGRRHRPCDINRSPPPLTGHIGDIMGFVLYRNYSTRSAIRVYRVVREYTTCALASRCLWGHVSTHCTLRIIYHCPGRTRSNSIATILCYSIAEAAAKRRGAAAVVAGTHVTWLITVGSSDDDDVGRGRGRLGGRKHMDCARCQQHLLGLGRLLPSRRGEVNGLAKLCYPPPPTLPHKLCMHT